MRLALVLLLVAGCSGSTSAPTGAADAALAPRRDLAAPVEDLAAAAPPDLATAPDLAPAPDLWMCQPQLHPGACGCPGLACCQEMLQGMTYYFCAGANTSSPDLNQRCFESPTPKCYSCGLFKQPCCYDFQNRLNRSCRPGFECHEVKSMNCSDTQPDCYQCDVAGCGQMGAPCCTLPPSPCFNGLACQNGVCK